MARKGFMRYVKYKGTNGNVGTHGWLEAGAVIKVTMQEFSVIENDPLFGVPDESEIDKDDPQIPVPLAKPIKFPVKMTGFNLRAIPWEGAEIFKALARYTKNDLLKILRAMKDAGVPVNAHPDWSKDILADSVVVAAITAGWRDENEIPAPALEGNPTP